MAGYKTRKTWSAPDIQFDPNGRRIRPEAAPAAHFHPTGNGHCPDGAYRGCDFLGCDRVQASLLSGRTPQPAL